MAQQSDKDRILNDSSDIAPYQLPGVELLGELTAADALKITADDLLATQETVVNRLANFGVKVGVA
jgi:hypothetical protein